MVYEFSGFRLTLVGAMLINVVSQNVIKMINGSVCQVNTTLDFKVILTDCQPQSYDFQIGWLRLLEKEIQ